MPFLLFPTMESVLQVFNIIQEISYRHRIIYIFIYGAYTVYLFASTTRGNAIL